jgi:hypothetical protein
MELGRWKATQEISLAREKLKMQKKTKGGGSTNATDGDDINGSVRFGGSIG